MSQVNESRKKEKTPKRKNNKTIKRKTKVKKAKNVVFVSNCVCCKGLWCDSCYGEYDLFD